MGCTASKLDNEDTVRRCKDRRRLIKEAVYARHNLAAAQSDYCRSLRLTGSALSDFAAGEPLAVSDQTPPAVLLRNPSSASSYSVPKSFAAAPSVRSAAAPRRTHQSFAPTPVAESVRSEMRTKPTHLRSASSVSSASSSVLNDRFKKRVGKPLPKLPHILSESSVASPPRRTKSSNFRDGYYPTAAAYDSTSQTSSVWNWENFYPPSPPNSEYFDRMEREKLERERMELERSERDRMEFERSEREKSKFRNIQESSEEEEEDEEAEKDGVEETTDYLREEVHCSEWGDHYSTTSSSDEDGAAEHLNDHNDEDMDSRSEIESRSNFGSSVRSEFVRQMPNRYQAKSMNSEDDGVSSVSYGEYGDMRIVVRHKNLAEIVAAIRENFDKAAEAGEKVSDMLEIGRAQLDKSFRQLKSMSLTFHFQL